MKFNKGLKITGIRVLNDNVIWIWEKNKSAVVIDPAVPEPVIQYLVDNDLYLILLKKDLLVRL